MPKSDERRHYFPQDTWESLKFFTEDEKLRLSPEIAAAVRPEHLAWAIINNFLQKHGHYPPKTTGEPKN